MKKTVLVSGATGGIGKAIVKQMILDGFLVIGLFNKNHKEAKRLSDKYSVDMYSLDLNCDIAIQETVKTIIEKYKKIDVLINNAGISQQKLFTDLSAKEISNMLDINLKGAMLLTKEVAPFMVSEYSGKIINISSVWGVCGGSCEVHYSASKAGLIGFSKALSRELGLSNINVNCIAPGMIDTDMNANISDEDKESFVESTSLHKTGKPLDVAYLVAFLASDCANYITGQVIGIDGGM